MSETIDRLTTTESLTAGGEFILPSGVNLYRGGKSAENADVASVSIALAAGAANVMGITITCLNAAGARIPKARVLDVWASEAATGIGITADAYSGDFAATTGAILAAVVAKKYLKVATAASGIAVLTLEDTAVPADQYIAVQNPSTGAIHVSAASGTSWGA